MNYSEVLENAKNNIGPNCKVCPECNGIGCGNTMPGPGSKAPGNGANDNYCAWKKIKLNMDTIGESGTTDTSTEFLGRKYSMPLMTAPIGSIKMQFNPTDDVKDFNEKCMAACESRGIVHAYGDGLSADVLPAALRSSMIHGFSGIPVFNPDTDEGIREKMYKCMGDVKPFAMSIVVDSAGLPHLKSLHGKAGIKSVEQLKTLKEYAGVPMIIKGVMTAKTAEKAIEAGADAIVVSNHGGRVLANTPATAEVLEEISKVASGRTKIIVDGGIRTGLDIFKALALGADMTMICRPVLISYYGGGQEGIECYIDKLHSEFEDTMYMCGAKTVSEITRDMVRVCF